MTALVGFGLAGLGEMGRVHAANLAGRIPSARLVRVADAIAETARTGAIEHGCRWSPSYEGLMEDDRVDAIVIATPPETHPEIIEAAAASGKHVFCEKPLARDTAAATRAVRTAERAEIVLQVGFHRRFDPDFCAARIRIEDGSLGRIYLYSSRMRNTRPSSLENLRSGRTRLLFDAACHELDTARWLVGEIDEIATYAAGLSSPELAELDRVDTAILVLRFVGAAIGTIDVSHLAGYGFDCQCEVVGSEATVRVDNPRVRQLTWLTPGSSTVDLAATYLDRFSPVYALELEAFTEALRGDGVPRVTGADGIASLALCEAAERARLSGAAVRLRHTPAPGGVVYEPEASRPEVPQAPPTAPHSR